MKNTMSLVHLAYIISLLRCLLGDRQFVKLTHFLGIILCYWKATALFYKAPLSYRCLLSRFHFLLTGFEINQCTAIWAKGQRRRKGWWGQGPPSAGVTSAQSQHGLGKPTAFLKTEHAVAFLHKNSSTSTTVGLTMASAKDQRLN